MMAVAEGKGGYPNDLLDCQESQDVMSAAPEARCCTQSCG